MTPEHYRRIEALYHAALEQDSAHRETFLRETCPAPLLHAVLDLLKAHDATTAFMEESAFELAARLLAERSAALVGQTLGCYRVLSLLGSGGMGDVYLVEDTRLGRKAALKLLPSYFTTDPERLRRFEAEARAASSLNHPNIVTVHDIGEAAAGRFIVMEWIDGQTLRDMISVVQSVETTVRLGSQVARALAVAHQAGIVHRDIKPENIMVRRDGFIKVLDFGIARLGTFSAQSFTSDRCARAPSTNAGTARYASPEQLSGEPITPATDLFSLGIILFELVTGRHPFDPGADPTVRHAVADRGVLPPSAWSPGIPPALDTLILRMLSVRDADRPAAAEVERALSSLASDYSLRNTTALPALHAIVGRERELGRLRAVLAGAALGDGRVVCVSGEPGIGKTTLMEQFIGRLETEGNCQIARGQCSQRLAGTEAFLPWLEAIDGLLHGESGDSFAQLLRGTAPLWHAHVVPGSVPHVEPQADSQGAMKRELTAFLTEAARRRPLVLFFDDIHWADASTVDLLAYIGMRLKSIPMLIVVAYRPTELLLSHHPFLDIKAQLLTRGLCEDVPLELLARRHVDEYLALEFGPHRFPRELSLAIHRKTEGNPLFMGDLVRDLRDHHVVVQEGGAWRLSCSVENVEQDLPASTREMIERRIARTGADEQRLLKAASVQGFEFDSNVLATVLAMEIVEVEDHVERLDRVHGLVRAIGEQTLADGRTFQRFRFVHVLYQNVLYASLSAARRTRWSLATAQALIDQYNDQHATIASHVAQLFETAHDPSRAVEYHLIASRRAAGLFAYHETITQVRRALELLKHLPDTTLRNRQELEFLTLLGPALVAVKGYAVLEVQDVYARAAALCERVGDERQQFTVLLNRWSIHELRGDLERAAELASQALDHATTTEDSDRLLMAQDLAGETAFYRGAFDTARHHLERCIALYNPEAHRGLAVLHGGYDFGVAALCMLAHDFWYLGQPDRALETNRRAIKLASELSHYHSLGMAWALVHGAFLHYLRRETDAARERAEAALKLCDEHDLVFWVAFARCLLGRAIAEQQDVQRGLRDMHDGIAAYRATGSEVEVPFLLSLMAEVCLHAGRLDEGLHAVVEALRIAQRKDIGFQLAELHRLRGELLLAQPAISFEDAEVCFHQALETGRRQGARLHQLRAACSLARLWLRRGRSDRARGALEESLRFFTEGFETRDLQDARLLLASVAS